MARQARVVVPGIPHHITQRGNRRQNVFFCNDDYKAYIELMHQWCSDCDVQIWAYCLMPNHIHLIAVPRDARGLSRAIAQAHVAYTRRINFREEWRGYLWQGRFASYPMDESYLYAAARYIELNPVRAGIAEHAADYTWSSARAHIAGESDDLVQIMPEFNTGNWTEYLEQGIDAREGDRLKKHARSGKPLGSEAFIDALEKQLKRKLRPGKRGPKGPRKSYN